MDPGNIVLLNGTSSAGKTSIARSLQEIMETPYLYTGVDAPVGQLHPKFVEISDGTAPANSDYITLVYQGGANRIGAERDGEPVVHGDGILKEVRLGPATIKIKAAQYRAVATLAAAGLDVIIDDVIFDRRVLAAAVESLPASRVLFVAVRLPLALAEQRERARGDRGPGGAAAFYHLVHACAVYDLELDTSTATPLECAQQIKTALETNLPRQAFHHLAATRSE